MRSDARIADAERILCRRAATVVATSEQVATHLRSLSNRQVHVISNGVDFQHFHTPRDLQCSPPLAGSARSHRAVYVGAFDARFCHRSVHAAARAHPSRNFLLAGPGSQRVADELGLPNVQGLGAVPYEELPALLQSCAVGLLPFSASDANAGRSPMKLFEYAAAGLAVAATQSFRQGRAVLPTLSLASTTEDFAQAVARSFELATDATAVAAAREAARAQDWGAKAGELMCLLQHGRADAPMPEAAADAAPLLPVPSSWN
jgi:glycosyltransferase involved in cell wall biosynthesis